jgi:hypothetical protein
VELNKPTNKWCQHCNVGAGCRIYDSKPSSCSDFSCVWLLSKETEIPDEYRPDKTHVVFWVPTDDVTHMAFRHNPTDTFPKPDVVAHEDPAYFTIGESKNTIAGRLFRALTKAKKTVCIINGNNRRMIKPLEGA